MIPRSKLEAVSQHGLGYAWASFWLPAWGDCCIADPAASPVGEMRLVPDVSGGRLSGMLFRGYKFCVAGAWSEAALLAFASAAWRACLAHTPHAVHRSLHAACRGLGPQPACFPPNSPLSAATRTLPWMPSHATSLATLSYLPGQPWEFCPRSGECPWLLHAWM